MFCIVTVVRGHVLYCDSGTCACFVCGQWYVGMFCIVKVVQVYMFCIVLVVHVYVFYFESGKSVHILYCDSGRRTCLLL